MIYLNINSRNHIKKYFKRNNTFFGNYVKSRVYIYSNTVHFKNLGLCCSIVRVNQQMRTRISFLLTLCLCIIVLKIKINKKNAFSSIYQLRFLTFFCRLFKLTYELKLNSFAGIFFIDLRTCGQCHFIILCVDCRVM